MTGRGWLGLLAALLLFGVGAIVWYRAEGTPPTVSGPSELLLGTAGAQLAFELVDERSGMRDVEIAVLRSAEAEAVVVLERSYPGEMTIGGAPGRPERVEVSLDPAALELADGDALLVVRAHDWSWRNGLLGNEARYEVRLDVDLKKPRVQVDSGLTYVERGGAGAVSYTIGEAPVRDGVSVGDAFFPGYPSPRARSR